MLVIGEGFAYYVVNLFDAMPFFLRKVLQVFRLYKSPSRVYGLDILRAAAILFVMWAHGTLLLPQDWATYANMLSFDGVSIFFVLSGFLIGGILIKTVENNPANLKSLMNFWSRRWIRTLPNYFLILGLLVALFLVFNLPMETGALGKYFIFSQNLTTSHPAFYPEAWSLAVEEWFYLLIPLLVFGFKRFAGLSAKRSILLTAVLVILAVSIFRHYRFLHIDLHSFEQWDMFFRKQVFTRLDSIMYGVLAAYLNFYHTKAWNRHYLLMFVVGIMLHVFIRTMSVLGLNGFGVYFSNIVFAAGSIATALLLPFLSTIRSATGYVYKAITYISLSSYSLYLVNLSVVQVWLLNIPIISEQHFLIRYILFWLISLSLSLLIYKYFEIRITALREKFKISRKLY